MLLLIRYDLLLLHLRLLKNTLKLILLYGLFRLMVNVCIINGVVFQVALGSKLFERRSIGGHLVVIFHNDLFLLDYWDILQYL